MHVFGERRQSLALMGVALVILEVVASVTFLAAYDFDVKTLGSNPGALPARGAEVAGLLRLGTIVDMLGYLAFAPIVLYLHRRLSAAVSDGVRMLGLPSLLTFCGLGFVLVGSIGAVLYASAGPPLLEASSGGSASATAARIAFAALGNGVSAGLWGTLEQLLLAVWLIGVGWLVRAEGRAFASLAMVAGLGALSYAARTGLTGHPPADITAPLDLLTFGALGLFLGWLLWLAVRLWQGR